MDAFESALLPAEGTKPDAPAYVTLRVITERMRLLDSVAERKLE